MKTFIITVSKTFLDKHPKKGKPTNFKKKIQSKIKIHTIRGNYKYWYNIVKDVNSDKAILSIRQWSGRPYKSKQKEIKQLKRLGIQKFELKNGIPQIDGKLIAYNQLMQLAKNDGLGELDFLNWFPNNFKGGIVHFTNFKY